MNIHFGGGRESMKKSTVLLGFSGLLLLSVCAYAQVEQLEGNWVLKSIDPADTDIGTISVDTKGTASFPQTIVHTIENASYNFNVDHRAKIELGENRQFTMASAGVATSQESRLYGVLSNIVATGVISSDTSAVAGIWIENQTYTKNVSTVEIDSASPVPFIMMREGYTPNFSFDFLKGSWQIEVNENSLILGWSGEVELGGEGTILGTVREKSQKANSPLAGLFTAKGSEFNFSYTTAVEVASLGEIAVTVEGSGTINAERTAITGTFTVTIEKTAAAGGGGISVVNGILPGDYKGTFKLHRDAASFADGWELYP